jgi:hypothetical protein
MKEVDQDEKKKDYCERKSENSYQKNDEEHFK